MRPKWSQNFLIDAHIANLCVDSLELKTGEPVLEIGPGRGVLTRILAEKTEDITAVEIDPDLALRLKDRFAQNKSFNLIQGDFLEMDLDQALRPKKFKVIGNLPYAVVSPILQKLLAWKGWSVAVVMTQKEVADRILAGPGKKEYGVLSVSVQSRCRIEKVCKVSRFAFRPVPKVESTVLKLLPLPKPAFNEGEEKGFFAVVKAGFAHRRKTVLNSLARSLKVPQSAVRGALEKCGLSPAARAETFSVEDFKRLSDILYNR